MTTHPWSDSPTSDSPTTVEPTLSPSQVPTLLPTIDGGEEIDSMTITVGYGEEETEAPTAITAKQKVVNCDSMAETMREVEDAIEASCGMC